MTATDAVTPTEYPSAPSADWSWTTSESIAELAPCFVAALGEMKDTTKARTADAGSYSYAYADLADVLSDARPVLAAHDLGLFQVPIVRGNRVEVSTIVLHASGQWIAFAPLSLPAGNTAQTIGSAITYGRRYSGQAAVGVASEDDDGRQASDAQPPTLLPQRLVDLFRTRMAEHDVSDADAEAIVAAATSGRTTDIDAVWLSETDALTRAVTDWFAAAPSGTASDATHARGVDAVPDDDRTARVGADGS